MKIFVTGADGFIGSHLVERLVIDGHTVKALSFYNSFANYGWLSTIDPETYKSIEIVQGDIRDQGQMFNLSRGIEAIMHLGALIAIPYSYEAPESYVDTNVRGTLNILNAAKWNSVSRVIHTSTSEVYGTAEFVPITEKHPLKGQSPYSATKIAADQMVLAFNSSFDLPTITLRPFNTFGPRQSMRAVIPAVIQQIASGKTEIQIGSLSPTRDFTYVSDTVNAFIKALTAPKEAIGKTINLGTGFEISIADTVSLISEIMGREIKINTDERRLRPENSEVERLVSDNSLAKSLLGWEPVLSGSRGFAEGLRLTSDWFSETSNLSFYPHDSYVT